MLIINLINIFNTIKLGKTILYLGTGIVLAFTLFNSNVSYVIMAIQNLMQNVVELHKRAFVRLTL